MVVPILKKKGFWIGFLSTIPLFIFFSVMYNYYNRDVIAFDEFIAIIDRIKFIFEGKSIFPVIWSHVNDHITFFPNIVILCNVYCSNWDLIWEFAIGLLLYFGTFLITAIQIHSTEQKLGIQNVKWLYPIILFFIFSFTQWITFTMGYGILHYSLVIFFPTFGFYLLTNDKFSWGYFIVAFFSGVIATFSFGSGIVFWPIGLLILLFKADSPHKRNSVILWIAGSSLILFLFSIGYNKEINFVRLFKHPIVYIKFILGFIGSPISIFSLNAAYASGALGLGAFIYYSSRLFSSKKIKFEYLFFYVSLSLFTICNALLTGLGRAIILPPSEVINRDWKIIATPFWISLFILIVVFMQFSEKKHKIDSNKNQFREVLFNRSFLIMLIILIPFFYSHYTGYQYLKRVYVNAIQPIRKELLQFPFSNKLNMFTLARIIPYVESESTREKVEFLLKNKLSIYRKGGPYELLQKEKRQEINRLIRKIENEEGLNEEKWSLLCKVGTLYMHLQDPNKANEYLERAVTIKPNSIDTLNQLSLNYYKTGNYKKAIIAFKKIAEIQPDKPEIFYNIGCLYSLDGQTEESARWLIKAIDKGYDKIEKIKSDADLMNLRESQHFGDVILKINQKTTYTNN